MNRIVSEDERVLFTSGGLLPAFIDRVPTVAAGKWHTLADRWQSLNKGFVDKTLSQPARAKFEPGGIVAGQTFGRTIDASEYVLPIDRLQKLGVIQSSRVVLGEDLVRVVQELRQSVA
ncbi:MAG: hypothetical protein AAFR36_32865, partial [Bacteroidota bacterium]